MSYREYKSPIELASSIKSFWILENHSARPAQETIITDAYPELIFHYRSPFSELDHSGNFVKQSAAVACGLITRPLVLQKEVGMSPKMHCRITRFRHVFDTLPRKGSLNWVQTALDSGFYDQSHLIRDFRQFTGKSPTSFLPDQTSFAQSINQDRSQKIKNPNLAGARQTPS